MQERKFDCDKFVENFKRNLDKPEVKKLDRIEKSLNDNIAIIESILESLKSDFNYIKNMPDNCVQKSNWDDNQEFNNEIPSFVEVVTRLEELEIRIDKMEKRSKLLFKL